MQILLLKIFLVLVFVVPQQYTLVQKIALNANYIQTDNFGQLYIYANRVLGKYNKSGFLLSKFSNQTYGEITAVDASDPYILMLFYEDLNQIVFLDDKLSPIGSPLNLDELGVFNISTVCKSKQFAVWIYDRFDNRIVQYGFNPKEVLQEINLDPLNIEDEIVFMRESGNYLVLNTGKQFLVFDQFGSYIKGINSGTEKSFQLRNKHIIYFQDKQLIIKPVETGNTDSILLNFIDDIENILIENNHLYIQKKDTVFIYKNE